MTPGLCEEWCAHKPRNDSGPLAPPRGPSLRIGGPPVALLGGTILGSLIIRILVFRVPYFGVLIIRILVILGWLAGLCARGIHTVHRTYLAVQ